MPERAARLASLALLLAGCTPGGEPPVLGTVEWDQVELIAEAAEPVLAIDVREGDPVAQGALLLRLDDRRAQAELAQARAEVARLSAVQDLQRNGARPEAIAELRARLDRARSLSRNAQQELTRVHDLRERRLSSPADLDRAQATARAADAEQRASSAALDQLLAGTRVEELAQTEAALGAANARVQALAIGAERLTVRAPRSGRVDSIPVKVGDQVARGAVLITLLVGDAAHARVFVPQRQRVDLAPGAVFEVVVEGEPTTLRGTLRHVRSAPSFTPYYALAGDDASRLAFIAEIDLHGESARTLPAGVPLQARRLAP